MSAQNIVSLGFNVEELTAEKKQVLDLFVDLFGQLKQYDGTRFNPLGNGGLVDLKKSLTDGAAAMAAFGQTAQKYNEVVTAQYQKQQAAKKSTDELTLATSEYKKIQDGLATTQAKANAAGSNAAENLAIEKEQLKQRNAELQAGVKYLLSETGSVLEAKAAISQLTIERNKQNATTDEGKAKIAELNAEIDKNNRFINENTADAESLTPAFEALNGELGSINKQLSEIELRGKAAFSSTAAGKPIGFDSDRYKGSSNITGLASGSGSQVSILNQDAEAYQKLTVQQKILEQGLQREQIGFKTVGQEMRNVKNTLDALDLAGLKNSETFEKVNIAYTETQQKVKDLHREQAILTTDAPALTALTGVARGLGGAYAFGAGASALFSDGNEKLDKELNKLVAVMTFLQGLTEAVSVLKERNAIVTALETEATKAFNFVKQIEASIFGKEKIAIEADTSVKAINKEATIANSEATTLNTAALEATTIATEGAESATIGLSSALLSTGIGAIIIAIGVSVGLLVQHLIELAEADNKAAERSADLAEEMGKTNEILLEQIRLSDIASDKQKKHLEDALTLAGKNKQNASDLLSIQKSQVDLNQKTSEDDVKKAAGVNDIGKAYQTIDEKIKTSTKSVSSLLEKQTELNEIAAIYKKAGDPSADYNKSQAAFDIYVKYKKNISEDDVKDQLQNTEKEISARKKFIDENQALLDKYDKSNLEQVELAVDIKQHADDEHRKITFDTANIEADAVKAKNELILNDDRSTLAQRLEAIKSNAEQEIKVAAASRNDALNKPGVVSANGQYSAEALNAIKVFGEKRVEISAATEQKQYQTIIEYNDRRIAYLNDINKNALEADAVIQDAISKDQQRELDARLNALKANIDDKTKEIIADYNLQITLAKEHNKTQEEFDKIESDKNKALIAVTADTQKQIYDIVTSYGEKRLKTIQDENKAANTTNAVTEQYADQLTALNKSLIDGNISYAKYVRDKEKLDQQYIKNKDNAEVADDQASLKRIKDFEDQKLQIQIDAARAELEGAIAGGDPEEIKKAQAKYDGLIAAKSKFDGEFNTLNTKLVNDEVKATTDAAEKIIAANKKIKENKDKLVIDSYNLAKQLVDASYENQINNIQTVIDKQNEQYTNEIAAVQRSTLSQQQQAAEVIILTAQKNTQDTVLKNQQKKEKISEAKFDRDVAVAEVAWNTGKAIMKDTAGVPFPLSLAVAASDAALGAIQIATILAKPIPTYGDGIGIPGKGRHPGGEAIVGERWTPEKISIPGYEPFILDKPTLINLPADSSVLPMTPSQLVWEIGESGMARTAAQFSQPSASGNEAWEIARWQMSQTKRMHERSQRAIINKIVVHVDADWQNYINKKVLGKG